SPSRGEGCQLRFAVRQATQSSELFGRVESWGDLGCRWRDPRLAAVYFSSVGVLIAADLAVSVVGFEKSECSGDG
ncbi:MAG: hypothetical protein ACK5YO_24785, partial [Planctomyces sp.]